MGYLCIVVEPGTRLSLESVLLIQLQSGQKCVYHLANYLPGLPHPHRKREWSSKGHPDLSLAPGQDQPHLQHSHQMFI